MCLKELCFVWQFVLNFGSPKSWTHSLCRVNPNKNHLFILDFKNSTFSQAKIIKQQRNMSSCSMIKELLIACPLSTSFTTTEIADSFKYLSHQPSTNWKKKPKNISKCQTYSHYNHIQSKIVFPTCRQGHICITISIKMGINQHKSTKNQFNTTSFTAMVQDMIPAASAALNNSALLNKTEWTFYFCLMFFYFLLQVCVRALFHY